MTETATPAPAPDGAESGSARTFAEDFFRLVTPSNAVLAITLATATYFVGNHRSGWWLITLILGAFIYTLLVNWIVQRVAGKREERDAKRLSATLAPALTNVLESGIGEIRTDLTTLQRSVDGVLTETNPLARQLGFDRLVYPTDHSSLGLERCLGPNQAIRRLWVMGLQANKWIHHGSVAEDPGSRLRNLIERDLTTNGQIRFLLLNPHGNTIQTLRGNKGEAIAKPTSVAILEAMAQEFPQQLQIRYYDELPRFRMVFCDDELILGCYSLTNNRIFRTREGAEAPHLLMHSVYGDDCWPMFSAFENHYDEVWTGLSPPENPQGTTIS